MNTSKITPISRSKPSTDAFLIAALLMLLLSVGLTGCFAGIETFKATETVSDSFTASAQTTVIVETFNGKINVQAGSSDQVAVTVTKTGSGTNQANAEADLKNVEVKMTQAGDTVSIIARRTDQKPFSNSGAEIEVTVPENAILDITTSNGKITSTGVRGDLKLTTSNGDLTVKGGHGAQSLTTSNGSVQVEAQSAQVNAQTSNGSITFTGSLAEGRQAFETSNGSVEISLPGDSQFSIDAHTSNGKISTEFLVTFSGSSQDNELKGTVGQNPAMSISVSTSNGSIKLMKSQ